MLPEQVVCCSEMEEEIGLEAAQVWWAYMLFHEGGILGSILLDLRTMLVVEVDSLLVIELLRNRDRSTTKRNPFAELNRTATIWDALQDRTADYF